MAEIVENQQKDAQEDSRALELLLQTSEIFLHTKSDTIDYHFINNKICELSGSTYSAFNIYNAEGTEYSTLSISGVSANIAKAVKILGFEITGKKWPHDPLRANKIAGKTITHFQSLLELTGESVSPLLITSLEKIFSLGAVIVAKIEYENCMLGDFTLLFTHHERIKNEQFLEVYLRQCGLFLSRLKYEKELLTSNERKDTILSIVSHDLRGPIGSFKNLVDFMLTNETYFTKDQIKNVMQEIYKTFSSMYNLTENLLNWAKMNTNKESLCIDETKLKSIFEIVAKSLKLQLNEKNITLINTIQPTAVIMADKEAIAIIARNLLSNAIKFSHQHSKIEVTSQVTTNTVTLSVQDFGMGMSKETLKKIEAQSRVSGFGTDREKGSGLGLSFCRDMIKAHNGEMKISSKEGKGTVVQVIFKAIREPIREPL